MIIRLQTLIPHSPSPSIPTPKSHKTTTVRPHHSLATTENIIPGDAGLLFREKIIYLKSLKVNPTKALQKNPNIRSSPLSTIQSVQNCLSSMGIEPSAVGRILDMLPTLLTCDPYLHLYPVLDFLLHQVQIPFHDIRKCIIRCPRLLLCNVDEQLKPTFDFLQKLGFVDQNRINCQTTVLLVSSVEHTLMPKIEFLMGLGFSYDDVVNMVLRSPGLLTFSIENNYRPKLGYFLDEMDGELGELKSFPQYFSFSLEAKIKPRHRLLVEHRFRMSLPQMLKVSDGEFNARLVEMQLRLVDERLL